MKLGALKELLGAAARISGVWRRMVERGFEADIDETAHTVLYPGRYHPKGEFPVLYLAISADCAYREKLKQAHGRPEDLLPLVTGSFDVDIIKALDLSEETIRKDLDVSLDRLLAPDDFSTPQSLAREARRVGFEAVRAPSAVGEDCRNLVVFKDKLAPPSRCLLKPGSVRVYP